MVPGARGGGPMMPPSTHSPARSPTSSAVAGEIALQSTNSGPRTTFPSAACGGQMESTTSTPSSVSAAVSPASAARRAVVSLRPAGSHSTAWPARTSSAPTAAPISPGCRIAIVVTPPLLRHGH